MNYKKMRRVALAATAVLASGCATAPGEPKNSLANQINQTFASDDPCSNNARNIGIAGGMLAGYLIGNSMGDGNARGRLIGAAAGGLFGGLIGSDIDRKRCELSKVAKQYDLDMTFAYINSNGDVQATQNKESEKTGEKLTIVGATVTVRDKEGASSHFEKGSDQLTPKAREYFTAIAAQYSPEKMLEGQTDANKRDEATKKLAQRRLFLIGHSDDTGSSQLNASLSERRAKAVAGYLKTQGVPENAIYYQGAGETLPIADNHTDAGRALNRRVEIIEVPEEATFKKYLEARKPNYEFYRPTAAAPVASTGRSTAKTDAKTEKLSKTAPTRSAKANTATTTSTAGKGPIFNFGGTPYSPQQATMNVGAVTPDKSSFNLFSKAYASSDTVALSDCTLDRPRAAGSVKSLRDGSVYKTNEHMPQLFGKTWAGDVNGNLVVINHLAVLRDGGTPANLPELKMYAQYKPGSNKKPEVNEEPKVNSYMVGRGVLYRMFPRGDAGLKCMDVLFATDGSTTAKAGKLIYTVAATDYVADFKPQLQ